MSAGRPGFLRQDRGPFRVQCEVGGLSSDFAAINLHNEQVLVGALAAANASCA